MSNPQFPDEPGYWLRRLFETVDGIDKKLDVHAEKLATQEVRIQKVEIEVSNLRDADDQQAALRRANFTFAITTLISLSAVVVSILT